MSDKPNVKPPVTNKQPGHAKTTSFWCWNNKYQFKSFKFQWNKLVSIKRWQVLTVLRDMHVIKLCQVIVIVCGFDLI